jgi:tetratricopeptide (TPR) repeat protein
MDLTDTIRSRPIQVVVILVTAFILYVNTLPNAFLYDDIAQVLNNQWITDIRYLPEIFFQKTWGFDPSHTQASYYRPMMLLLFMAEYFIFGLEPWGWHLTNIIFHALNGIIALLLFSTLFEKYSNKDSPASLWASPLSLLAALIFIAHPARTEVVAWVSAIPELSFTLFLLLSLYLYIRYRDSERTSLLLLSALSFFLSTLSKETSLVLPILIIAFDIVLREKNKRFRVPLRYIPYIIVIIVYFILRINALHGLAPRPGSHPYLSGFQYFLNVFPLFIDHMRMLAVPLKLSIYHVFYPVYSAGEFWAILSVLLSVVLFAVFFKLRKRERLYLFAFTLVVLPLLPALIIPALDRNPFAERYLYLSGTGFSLIIALIFAELYNYFNANNRGLALSVTASAFIILFIAYGAGTVKRNFEWKSRFTLWSSSVKNNPQNYYALHALGMVYMDKGEPTKAIALFKGSIDANNALRNQDPLLLGLAHLSLGDSYRLAKRPAEATYHYKIAILMDPMRFDANLKIAILYHELGEFDKALTHYGRAATRAKDKDDMLGILMNTGNIYAKMKKWSKALELYDRALEITPDDPVILGNRGIVLRKREERK